MLEFNGGWTYPGVSYILKRLTTEVTTSATDLERKYTSSYGNAWETDCFLTGQRTTVVVFDCKAMPEIDFTIVQVTRCMCACDYVSLEDQHHF